MRGQAAFCTCVSPVAVVPPGSAVVGAVGSSGGAAGELGDHVQLLVLSRRGAEDGLGHLAVPADRVPVVAPPGGEAAHGSSSGVLRTPILVGKNARGQTFIR